ncbi:MAG: ribosomal RNA small subunit methyltransferase I [Candidatus Sericytochromatia bacterium]|nr:MAG: ribosomal RNA small subunit methyltransferase I [Candidatus Sericytochromatia bacterium]
MSLKGKIYLCGTPIGNLDDISFRLINTLKNVDFILCEDTRNTIKILNHLSISKPLYSYHSYNENIKTEFFINQVLNGKNIALVSDAGMPLISDPGFPLVKMAIENDIELIPVSGPSAFLLNLVVSGFPSNIFIFIGFLPNEKSKRDKIFNDIKNLEFTIILYEAPHKIEKTLDYIYSILGDRNICIGKEITKKHENFWRGKISEFKNKYPKNKIKGEFCIAIEGISKEKNDNIFLQIDNLNKEIESLKRENLTKKEIAKILSKKFDLSSKEIYNKFLI